MTTDARRDDLYRLAALLSDLDRILNPLPRHEGGEYQVVPNPPPPLPPTGPYGAPTGATGTAAPARSAGEWRAQSPAMPRTSQTTSRRGETPGPLARARPGSLPAPVQPRLEADRPQELRAVEPAPKPPPADEEEPGAFTAVTTQGQRLLRPGEPLLDVQDQPPGVFAPGGALPASAAAPPESTTRLPPPARPPTRAQGAHPAPPVRSDAPPAPAVFVATAMQVDDTPRPPSEAVPSVWRRQPGGGVTVPSPAADTRLTPRATPGGRQTPAMSAVGEPVPASPRATPEGQQTPAMSAVGEPVPASPRATPEGQQTPAMPAVVERRLEPPRAPSMLPPPRPRTAGPGSAQVPGQRAGPARRFTRPFSAGTVEHFRPREIALRVQLPGGEERPSPEEVAAQPPLSEPVFEAFDPALFETAPLPLQRLGHRMRWRGRTIGFLSPAELQQIEQRLQRRFLDRTVRRLP
jgi:hypothetical protein